MLRLNIMVIRRKGVRRAPAGKRKLATRRPGVKKVYRRKAAGRRPAAAKTSRLLSSNGGLTLSKFMSYRAPHPSVKAMKAVTQPSVYQINDGQIIQPTQARQDYKSFQSLTRANLQGILNTIPVGGAGVLAPGYRPPNRAVIESLVSELTLSNQGNSAQELAVIDVVLKRDLLVQNLIRTGIGVNSQLWSVNGLNGADDFILQGIRASTGQANTDSTDQSRYIGSIPFDSQFFRDYFKVIKRTDVLLSPGGSHRHNVVLKPNRVIDQSMAGNENLWGIKGLTYMTLVYVRGIAAYDLDSAVGTTPAHYTMVVHTQRVKFSWLYDGGSQMYGYSTLDPEGVCKVRNPGNGNYVDAGPAGA